MIPSPIGISLIHRQEHPPDQRQNVRKMLKIMTDYLKMSFFAGLFVVFLLRKVTNSLIPKVFRLKTI